MKDAWLDFEDLKKRWLERDLSDLPMLPLKNPVESYVESQFIGAFLLPESQLEAVKRSRDTSWHALQSRHPLCVENGYKHFLSISIRRSLGLKLSGWHAYSDASGRLVAERRERIYHHVKESGVFVNRELLFRYAARMRLRLGFLIDSIRYTERALSEVGTVDKEFLRPHAHFEFVRQKHHLAGGPRMKVRSVFWGKVFV